MEKIKEKLVIFKNKQGENLWGNIDFARKEGKISDSDNGSRVCEDKIGKKICRIGSEIS